MAARSLSKCATPVSPSGTMKLIWFLLKAVSGHENHPRVHDHSPGGPAQRRQVHSLQFADWFRAACGNWPGKTVEQKSGVCHHKNLTLQVVDLPGTYSLTANSVEERIAPATSYSRPSLPSLWPL